MTLIQITQRKEAVTRALAILSTVFICGAYGNETHQTDKKSADAYWQDFKQDSKQTWNNSKEAFRDGWIEGKLETALALNKYLDAYKIDIDVNNGTANLTGKVSSDVEKELAGNIALGIEGIDAVNNDLVVEAGSGKADRSDTRRTVAQYMSDISTTAAIKTELLASDNIKGMEINVDTYNDAVTLTGTVNTGAQKQLAESIAAKHNNVKNVSNKLNVKSR